MSGATTNFNSNIGLALSAAPQGVYSPLEQADMDDHFSSTQTLSQVVSDTVTLRVLFLVAAVGGSIITFDFGGSEIIGRPCDITNIPYGFLVDNVLPGEYAVVWVSGIIRGLTGLTPARAYRTDTGGTVTLTNNAGSTRVGFSIDATSLWFRPL